MYALEYAEIEWRGGHTPVSIPFGDVYYPPEAPEESSLHTFLVGNKLPAAWQKRERFTIGEVGFGTGLNFLLTAKSWAETTNPRGWLHFVSCERYPLRPEDLSKALSAFPDLRPLAEELIAQYPPPLMGHHRLCFPKYRVSLDLIFDDATIAFANHRFTADAWYLDGFAPEQNKELWSEELFQIIATRSHQETSIATFSSAGWVRRNLEAVGCRVEKVPGYGRKRESICGVFEDLKKLTPQPSPPSRVAIVGGGLAGLATAHQLSLHNISSAIFEQEDSLTAKASGNARGVILPYFTAKPTISSEFHLTSYLAVTRLLRGYGLDLPAEYRASGIVHFLSTERLERIYKILDDLKLHPVVQRLSGEEVTDTLGTSAAHPAFFYPEGAALSPTLLGDALRERTKEQLEIRSGTKISHLSDLADYDAIVIAGAYEAKSLPGLEWLPIEPVRGQLSLIPPTETSRTLQHILCYDGYLLPEHSGSHLIGATYEHNTDDNSVRPEEERELIARLKAWAPGLGFSESSTLSSRVSFRTSTRDRLPLVGKLPAESEVPLYSCLGFGSRGLTTILPCADLLVSEMVNAPLPFSDRVHNGLAPDRFAKRAEKRKKGNRLNDPLVTNL